MKIIKKLIRKATSAVSRAVNKAKSFAINVLNKVAFAVLYGRATLASAKGEGYVDSGVKILIAVVIGALLLAGLYTLFNSTKEMFSACCCCINGVDVARIPDDHGNTRFEGSHFRSGR